MVGMSYKSSIRRIFVPLGAFALAIAACFMLALAGGAGASPLVSNGSSDTGIPLPPATVPATIVPPSATSQSTSLPQSPTLTAGPGTFVPTSTATATSRPASSTTPTIPGPPPTGEPTILPCVLPFTDVQPTDWFYEPVYWMFCNGVVSGYPDNTFRPGNLTSRGQIMKIAMGAFHLPAHTDGGPHFADVPEGSTFYSYIETAYFYSVVNGYPCGGPGEPCDGQNRRYFRPGSQVTRGQLTKITVLSAMRANPVVWVLLNPSQPTFSDVTPSTPFYTYIETAVAHDILQGYTCGGPGEPCPGRYFRSNANATRAQLAKIVYRAVTQP